MISDSKSPPLPILRTKKRWCTGGQPDSAQQIGCFTRYTACRLRIAEGTLFCVKMLPSKGYSSRSIPTHDPRTSVSFGILRECLHRLLLLGKVYILTAQRKKPQILGALAGPTSELSLCACCFISATSISASYMRL